MRIQLRRVEAALLMTITAAVVTYSVRGADEKAQPRITGTYSDMHYVSDAGDVIGTEIKIVFTGTDFEGALQIAVGSPSLITVRTPGTFAAPFLAGRCEVTFNSRRVAARLWCCAGARVIGTEL